jgi:hypothetical protein
VVSAHQFTELLDNAPQQTQTVVLSQRAEEVLQDVTLVGTGNLLQFLDDLLLVADGQSRGVEDGGQLGVSLEDFTQLANSLGDLLQGRSLCRSSVLEECEEPVVSRIVLD